MDNILTVGELFAGIGGFSLGLEMAGGFETKWFVEIDEFCNKVLQKNFPKVKRYKDVKEVHGYIAHTASAGLQEQGLGHKDEQFTKQTKRNRKICERCLEPVDVITGGVPCQPASCAGKRRGTEDDRWLWHEAIRIIGELTPSWVILENVAGILSLQGGLPFEQVCVDLETQGYEVQPIIIPACAKDAPHRRDRVWIVAKSRHARNRGRDNGNKTKCERALQVERPDCNVADTKRVLPKRRNDGQEQIESGGSSWEQDWYEVAAEFCRVDARISNRVDRLKSLGNAVVPQVVAEIGKAIKSIYLDL